MPVFSEDIILTVQLLRDDELVDGYGMAKDYVDLYRGRTWIPKKDKPEYMLNKKFMQFAEAELECRRLGI